MGATTKKWFRSVIASIIGGAANAITVTVVDPEHFNIFNNGFEKLAAAVIIGALLSLAMFLKQEPVPEWDGTDRRV